MRFVLVAILCGAQAACSNVLTRRAPDPSSAVVEASVLVARVSHALHSAGVEGSGELSIDAQDSTVVLEGSLATPELVELAAATALAVEGVDAVVCRIDVAPAEPPEEPRS